MLRVRSAWCIASLAILSGILAGCGAPAAPSTASKVEFKSAEPIKTAMPTGGTTAKGVAPTTADPAPPGVKTGDYRGGLR